MNTQEILTIIAMAALGLCLVLAFSKGMTKNLKTKSAMTHVCSFLVVIAVALLAVTQFLSEKENMDWEIGTVATASMPNGRGSGGKKMGMGLGDTASGCPGDFAPGQKGVCSPNEGAGPCIACTPTIPEGGGREFCQGKGLGFSYCEGP
jgi:hypothetical protein